MMKNLLSIDKISIYQFSQLLDLTLKIKDTPKRFKDRLSGLIIAGVFQGLSFFPTVSFQTAVSSLNGKYLLLKDSELQTPQNNLSSLSCKCLEKWVHGILIQTQKHKHIVEMAEKVKVPVINAGSEDFVPCQALADFFTIKEQGKDLADIKIAFVGNQRNLCHSLLLASATAGSSIHVASPKQYQPLPIVKECAVKRGRDTGFDYRITENPEEAVSNADVIYYSNFSAGSSSKKKERLFEDQILSVSKKDALFMFPIPFREQENILFRHIPSDQRLIFSQADNRLHIKKAIMVSLIKGKKEKYKNG